MAAGRPSDDGPERDQLPTLRSLLVLFTLLTQQESQDSILRFVTNAVPSIGPCRTAGIFLDGRWQDDLVRDQVGTRADTPPIVPTDPASIPPAGAPASVSGMPWAWTFPLSCHDDPPGYLVVGADVRPAEHERFMMRVLAQQAGVALANARLHSMQRRQADELLTANHALERSVEVHTRLTNVALAGEGQEGVARAVYELTGRATAIEDRFGNLRAWAGPQRPEPYPKDGSDARDQFLDRLIAAGHPVREGKQLRVAALLGGIPVGVLVLHDPEGTAGVNERMALEHAATVLCTEIARLQGQAEADVRLRTNLVLDLIAGGDSDQAALLNRTQALGYDLARPHRVVIVDAPPGTSDIDPLFRAVIRAARRIEVGSLLAPRLQQVIVLADSEASWDRFGKFVTAEWHRPTRIGVGGRYNEPGDFPRSYHEAVMALQIQQASGGDEQVTIFGNLGVYQILASNGDTFAMEHFVYRWLGMLIDHDAAHGSPLVATLSEYLDRGRNYDTTAQALSIHRSTLKYRLGRIRQVSGHDLGDPDTQFNLQLATRAWRTMKALRSS
jgi:sugar diacid utilization regulator